MKQKLIIIVLLVTISSLLALRSCDPRQQPSKLPFNPDSLAKDAKIIDRAIIADKAKEVKSYSVHKKQTNKVKDILKEAEIIPCDTFKVEILKEVPILIAADSTEIANLRRVNCDLEAKILNLQASHANDSTTIFELRKQVKKRFWKGFKAGFVTGVVFGILATGAVKP